MWRRVATWSRSRPAGAGLANRRTPPTIRRPRPRAAKPEPEKPAAPKRKRKPVRTRGPRRRDAKSDPFPRLVDAELPTLVQAAPNGDDWLHELKFDGYRMIAFKDNAHVRYQTRNHLDWTSKIPYLAEAIGRLKVGRAIFDGEVVAFDDRGISNFQLLQKTPFAIPRPSCRRLASFSISSISTGLICAAAHSRSRRR